MARWEYMHVPAMTAAYRLDPEFARRKFSRDEQAEVKSVLKQMATTEHPYPDMLSELADFEEALRAGLQDLDNNVAFSSKARNMAPYKWAMVYMSPWPNLPICNGRPSACSRCPALRRDASARGRWKIGSTARKGTGWGSLPWKGLCGATRTCCFVMCLRSVRLMCSRGTWIWSPRSLRSEFFFRAPVVLY